MKRVLGFLAVLLLISQTTTHSVQAQSGAVMEFDQLFGCESTDARYDRRGGDEQVVTCSKDMGGYVFTYIDACSDNNRHPAFVETTGIAHIEEVWLRMGMDEPLRISKVLITYSGAMAANSQGVAIRINRTSTYTAHEGVVSGISTFTLDTSAYTQITTILTEWSVTGTGEDMSRSEGYFCSYRSPQDVPVSSPPSPLPTMPFGPQPDPNPAEQEL